MFKYFLGLLSCLMLLGKLLHAQSQDLTALWSTQLFEHGFEQVHIVESEDSLKVYFEHRNFRNPIHSMEYAQRVMGNITKKKMFFIPLYHNRPMGIYKGDGTEARSLNSAEYDFYRSQNQIGAYRFHFRIVPDVSARFGNYEQPVRAKTNIILDTRVYLLPGLSVQTGLLIPIQNSLDGQDLKPRWAPSQLTYFNHMKNDHYAMVSAGTYFSDRYGIDFQYRWAPLNGRWSLGLEVAFTGEYFVQGERFNTGPMEDLLLLGDLEYRTPIEDVSIRLTGGRFLYNDLGARLGMIKQFGNVDIGLFVSSSNNGNTVGFQFAFPLFPGKILRGKKVELRTTEEFRWEYNYNGDQLVNRNFRLGMPKLGDITRQYNGHFIRSNW
ncbi:YjbH domain-containing protein [Echinicola sp. CAU 1574]|uniref:YjbH domain-containing protein n=1 Tax=Echinicola arenosa TaxID=2774144 RepID=A0ABR9ANW5_9BACT|nr:YjbH domain-containing protein [Echinicola arenosa]MBD8490052.1 YjbH domain-containing protein [Echinicola arenosa]